MNVTAGDSTEQALEVRTISPRLLVSGRSRPDGGHGKRRQPAAERQRWFPEVHDDAIHKQRPVRAISDPFVGGVPSDWPTPYLVFTQQMFE